MVLSATVTCVFVRVMANGEMEKACGPFMTVTVVQVLFYRLYYRQKSDTVIYRYYIFMLLSSRYNRTSLNKIIWFWMINSELITWCKQSHWDTFFQDIQDRKHWHTCKSDFSSMTWIMRLPSNLPARAGKKTQKRQTSLPSLTPPWGTHNRLHLFHSVAWKLTHLAKYKGGYLFMRWTNTLAPLLELNWDIKLKCRQSSLLQDRKKMLLKQEQDWSPKAIMSSTITALKKRQCTVYCGTDTCHYCALPS